VSEPTTALPQGGAERRVGGRYRLEQMVGRGGSAEVWAAEDEALARRVAVKLVTVSGGEDAGRVQDEARLLARLSHPGLVPVYDAGTDDHGRPWVVMELVVGETLADAVKRGPLDPTRVATIGRVLAEALAHVHSQGLVHRDVKPANVLLGKDDRVRLTDFGIARLVDAAKVTATGLTVGTASYLSPEQVTGSAVGPATDVYALGLVLLECLTGRREYPGSTLEAAVSRLARSPRIPPELPHGWPGLLEALTVSEPERRPVASEAARELAVLATGGEATTVLAAPDLSDRTQVLPVPPRTARPPSAALPPRPATVSPVPARGSSGWKWALALVALVAVLALGGVFLSQQLGSGGNGRTPAQVRTDLPAELRKDLTRLQEQAK
jgi:eukaryotic-like serine/threonine-protein kinase